MAQATSSALRSAGVAPDVGWRIDGGVSGSQDGIQDVTMPDASDMGPPGTGMIHDFRAPYSAGRQYEDASGRFRPIGIFKDTYILAEDGEDLVIIDQHAAHERIIYEGVLKGLTKGINVTTQTLIPQPLDFAPDVVEEVVPYLSELAGIGILLDEFGESSFLLREFHLLSLQFAELIRLVLWLLQLSCLLMKYPPVWTVSRRKMR